jgi:hypothetical protein
MLGPKSCWFAVSGRRFDELRNLRLIKNTFANTAQENMIVRLFIKQMGKRKTEGRIWKSNVKDPSFLKFREAECLLHDTPKLAKLLESNTL